MDVTGTVTAWNARAPPRSEIHQRLTTPARAAAWASGRVHDHPGRLLKVDRAPSQPYTGGP